MQVSIGHNKLWCGASGNCTRGLDGRRSLFCLQGACLVQILLLRNAGCLLQLL